MKSDLPQEVLLLLAGLCIIGGFFVLSLIRIFLLSRSNRRMRAESAQMTRQSALQQLEVTGIHHDAMSWRAKTQRQFDALRSDLSHRLHQAELGGRHALQEMKETHQKALSAALAQISELEAALAAKTAAMPSPLPPAVSPGKPPPPPSSVAPSLVQALEAELAAAKAEAATSRQQNAMLQRALQLARRRLSAGAARKSPLRSSARSA